MRKIYRQGDVLLREIKIPKSVTKIKCKNRIILAEGEVTGHAHAISDTRNATMFSDTENNRFYLMIIKPVKLEHEEHGAINLPIGDYEVIRQREYTPANIKTVLD